MQVKVNSKSNNFISKTLVCNTKDGKVVREALRVNIGAWLSEEWLLLKITNGIREEFYQVGYNFKDIDFRVINGLIDIFDRSIIKQVKNEIEKALSIN